jgi:type I restriction enzyme M protein
MLLAVVEAKAAYKRPDEGLQQAKDYAEVLGEQPLPAGRKNYTKTQPIQFEEFAGCLKWWKRREENERAWKVSAADILANGCNLDIKNPNARQDLEHMPPEQLADSILKKEQRIAELMAESKAVLAEGAR